MGTGFLAVVFGSRVWYACVNQSRFTTSRVENIMTVSLTLVLEGGDKR